MEANECSGESLYSACSSTPRATGTAVTECSGESLYSACSSTPSATGTAVIDSETGGCSDSGSLWQRLKCAKPSQLARKRKVKTNAPPIGAKRSQCRINARSSAYTPHSVTPRQRVAEFPGECLDVSGGKLFCNACREKIILKCQVIRLHIQSKKHASGKERLQEKTSRDMDIAKCFKQYSQRENVV